MERERQRAVEHRGWHVESLQSELLGSSELSEFEEEHGLRTLPEMFFGRSFLVLGSAARGVRVLFHAQRQVARCAHTEQDEELQVAPARKWDQSRDHPEDVAPVGKEFQNWTFTSDYEGDMEAVDGDGESHPLPEEPTDQEFDMQLLTRRDSMVFFDEVEFFEDELNDFGHCGVSVKVRVMKEFFFVLLRYALRVDGVLVRVRDVRLMHVFDTDYMLKEVTVRDKKHADFASTDPGVPGSFYEKPDLLCNDLPVRSTKMTRVRLPVAASA